MKQLFYRLRWLRVLDSPFKLPRLRFYFGEIKHGTPYFLPRRWVRYTFQDALEKTFEHFNKLKEVHERLGREYKVPTAADYHQKTKEYLRYKKAVDKKFGLNLVGLGWKTKFECYDEKTQVLTDNGWKFFKDVLKKDLILCLNDDGYGEYLPFINKQEYSYEGLMYYLNSQGVNLLVTPNHNLYVAKGNQFGFGKNNITVKRPFELYPPNKYFRKTKRFLKSFNWAGTYSKEIVIPEYKYLKKIRRLDRKSTYIIPEKRFKTNSFLKFLGFFVAEGCVSKQGREISIAACNDGSEKSLKEQLDFEKVLLENGLPVRKKGKNNTAVQYRIYDKQLGLWLLKECGKLAQNKKVPSFIKNLPPEQIKIFLDWLFRGDGHKSKTAHTYATVSKELSEDVEELLLKAGYTFSTYEKDPPSSKRYIDGHLLKNLKKSYHTNWLKQKNDYNIMARTIRTAKSYIEEYIPYKGKVYCLTVPYNKLFVKREGKGVWCGNSYRHEWNPMLSFVAFGRQFCVFVTFGDCSVDMCYWEAWLYYRYETGRDKNKLERLKEVFDQYSATWTGKDGSTNYYYSILRKKYIKLLK